MSGLELKTQEGIYRIHEYSRDYHFSIECACRGKNGLYLPLTYKNIRDVIEEIADKRIPIDPSTSRFRYTFYMNTIVLREDLSNLHTEDNKQPPLTIICGDCSKEFDLTLEKYTDLIKKITQK